MSEFDNTVYDIPEDILMDINSAKITYPNNDGVRRANFILKNRKIKYQALERIKHDMQEMPRNDPQYLLVGGNKMANFIRTILNANQNATKTRRNVHVATDIQNPANIFESTEPDLEISEHALAVIVNKDNEFLLLKRINDGWAPNKYGLAGGHMEDGETPEQACIRETFEETGLRLSHLAERIVLERVYDGKRNIEHIFCSRHKGNNDDVVLSEEHTEYGWFKLNSIKKLDTVPNLIEYISICFKNYE